MPRRGQVVSRRAARAATDTGGAPEGYSNLPPPGDERREVLRKRYDALQQEAAELAAELEQEKIPEKAFEPDHNVRSEAYANKDGNIPDDAELKITNKQPGYKYAWIHRDRFGNTGDVQTNMMLRLGWEVVTGDMPEARERMAATGERHLIDCRLMRIRTEVDEENQQKNRIYRQWRETGVSQELLEQAAKHGNNIYDLENAPPAVRQVMTARLSSRGVNSSVNQMAAKQLAMRALDRHIRAGTLPGLMRR